MSSSKFNLVQRLDTTHDGIPVNPFGSRASQHVSSFLLKAGATVDLAYMGSSEFEDPQILVGAANRIASAAHELQIVTRVLTRPTYSEDVHFLATGEILESEIADWESWTASPSSLEDTGYFKDKPSRVGYAGTVGWWALNEDLIWTRERSVAENMQAAFVTILDAAASE